jgi:hypothetical protein
MAPAGSVREHRIDRLAVRAGPRDAVQAGRLRDPGRAPGRRLDPGALQRLQRGRLPRAVRAVSEQAANLRQADALGSDRHHNACQARFGLAQFERVDPVALRAKLLRELSQAIRVRKLDWIPAELRTKRRVHHQTLDQRSELFGLFSG